LVWKDLGVMPVRRLNGRGRPAPHLSLQFDSHLFSVDTSRTPKSGIQPHAYLITHAHSDHYGKSAMLSPLAVASKETARALEIRYGKRFMGQTFTVGEKIDVAGVEVSTYSTRHTIGSAAFCWENEAGCKTLVTGDVKDYKQLPKCDILVAEGTYGDPWDSSCIFDDDLTGFWDALQAGSAFGAYAFGKAQRAVSLIRGMGYKGEIGMDEQSLALTRELMPSAGPLSDFQDDDTTTNVVTPPTLHRVKSYNKFILTGMNCRSYPKIRLSDHLDFRGLMHMFDHVQPRSIIAYHPEGTRTKLLAHYLRQMGKEAISVDEVDRIVR